MKRPHAPVLLREVLDVFAPLRLRTFFDGTLGAGGHARALLEAHPELECYVGCDRDRSALQIARENLASWSGKIRFIHGAHGSVREHLRQEGIASVDGMLIDAGVSSMQLDRPERGFSFQGEGPLDMRMDSESPLTAQEVVNRYGEKELEAILRNFGEEPRARAIARAIVAARKKSPLKTTQDLVRAIAPVARGKKHLHFATLTFQALRIAVNGELEALERGIREGVEALSTGGRIAVISFHRLEDRIAKQCFKELAVRCHKRSGLCTGVLNLLTDKPIEASDEEIRENPRCRSAKLRAAEKAGGEDV